MQEPQQCPRIDRHAAGDVADCHQIRPSDPFAPPKHLIDLPAVPGGCAHRRAPCRMPPPRILPFASCRQRSDRQRESFDDTLRLRHFLIGHLLEVERSQTLPPGCGFRGIDLQFDLLFTAPAGIRQGPVRPSEKCVRGTPCRRFRLPIPVGAADHRQKHRHHSLVEPRITPEQPEDLAEDLSVFVPAHKAGMENPVEILPAGESGQLDRTDGLGHLTRPHLQSGQAKCPCKMHDVVNEPSLRLFVGSVHRIARSGPPRGPSPSFLNWTQLSPRPRPGAA